MIKENIDNLTVRTKVTRICDDCGREDSRLLREILTSANRKKNGKDYCKKCSYKYRILPDMSGEKSILWKGGKSLTRNGYYRINGGYYKGKYEHKVKMEKYIGREITKKEKVHHIDGDKLNNEEENLFLCKNKRHHSLLHYQMEELGLKLFLDKIWFDKNKKEYVLKQVVGKKVNFQVDKKPSYFYTEKNKKTYAFVYLGGKKHQPFHRYKIEKFLKRKLKANEQIHHIDGDTLNNEVSNLISLNRSEHRNAHNSLQRCILELFRQGHIKFNKKKEEYYVV